ncbi:NAD(+)/NADH kinase [Arthrobacter frigidicola]|nr:NAD(+)/NADH kinase [Arthrobacter frigidicola]
MELRRLGLVVHGGKRRAIEAARGLTAWAGEHGIDVAEIDVWSPDEHGHLRIEHSPPGTFDLVVTIGGDGTFLRGVAVAQASNSPILGVNVGRVGFLTEVEPEHLIEALNAVMANEALEERRLTLTMRSSRPLRIPKELGALLHYERGPTTEPPEVRADAAQETGWGIGMDVTALNDVVFEKLTRDRQASVAVYVGSRHFVSYSADALIIATPTGSTAYSFAAGGPVVSPRAQVLVFTPVAAHMVFDRSLIVAADELVSVRVLERSGQVSMSIDGRIVGVLDPGDWVSVYARPTEVRMLRLQEPDFFGRVRDRFGLVDAAAAAADGDSPVAHIPSTPKPDDMKHVHIPTPALEAWTWPRAESLDR